MVVFNQFKRFIWAGTSGGHADKNYGKLQASRGPYRCSRIFPINEFSVPASSQKLAFSAVR
jgi:hypothetical protein